MAGPTRNRLAKPLPDRWRDRLVELDCPRRKYTALCTLTVAGEEIPDVVIEDGWIIAVGRAALAAMFEQRIEFDPLQIVELQLDLLV